MITWDGKFLSEEKETEFRKYYLDRDIRSNRRIIRILFIPILLYLVNDHKLFGWTSQFYTLLGVRVALIAISIFVLARLKRVSDPDRFDLVMFVWALTILTGVVYVNLTRPEFLLHSIVDVSILCFIYFPFQNRLLYQLLIGLYFSGFNLIIIFMLRDNISHGKATVAFVHITINLIGLYVSRQLFLYRHGDYMAMKNEEGLRKKMEEIAIKDSLSGLASRWHFFEEATQSMNIFLRYQRRFSLILVDIDNLKLLNDRYGHLTGDDIIRSVASVIRQNLRKTDIAGRVGGDEFAILLPETPLSSASEISNRILLHSRSIEVQASGETIRPTISMGVIESMKLDTDFAESYRRADAAMYRAKMCGRDRMEISPPLELSLEPDPISM